MMESIFSGIFAGQKSQYESLAGVVSERAALRQMRYATYRRIA